MTMKILTTAAVAAALIATVPAVGAAQDLASNFKRDKNTSVRQRPRPDYEAIGMKAGGFTLYPRLTVEATHDDNVYAVATGKQSDTIWRVKPEVALRSNWSQHALGAFASASINRYTDFDTEDTEEYTFGVNGRVDVQRGSYLAGSLQYQVLTEPRSAPTSPFAATSPVEYTVLAGNLTGVKEFNRLRLTGRLDSKTFDYDDVRSTVGGVIDQDTRDRDEFYYGGKAEYAVSPDTAVFASVVGNTKEYDLAIAGRDSDGYTATVGANFDLSQAMRGEIEAGYMSQSYDNAAYDNIDGFSAKGRVEWFPTELTTLNVAGSRSIEESVASGSQGYIASTASIGIDHELLRNVLLAANASYGKDNYESIDRDDKRTGFNASAAYLLNRNIGLFLTYNYLKQESSGIDKARSFTDNKIAASIALQF